MATKKKTEEGICDKETPCADCDSCLMDEGLMTDFYIQEFHDTLVESMEDVDNHVSCLLGAACHELETPEIRKHSADQLREASRIFRVNIKKQQELAEICDKYAHLCESGNCPCITVYQNVMVRDSVVWMHRDDKMAMGQGNTFTEAFLAAEQELMGKPKPPPSPTEIN